MSTEQPPLRAAYLPIIFAGVCVEVPLDPRGRHARLTHGRLRRTSDQVRRFPRSHHRSCHQLAPLHCRSAGRAATAIGDVLDPALSEGQSPLLWFSRRYLRARCLGGAAAQRRSTGAFAGGWSMAGRMLGGSCPPPRVSNVTVLGLLRVRSGDDHFVTKNLRSGCRWANK